MAKRLSEEMVIARTKISDLSKIKRLNCWGSELVDVSLLKRMPNVEVLSLSINKINSLEDFGCCRKLEELYIRQNDIRDINQIVHLQNLPNLKNLWLAENPCTLIEGYRVTVLRTLPQLQKLDNVAITPEELKDAQRRGSYLQHPDDVQESEEEYTQQQQYNNRYRRQSVDAECSPVESASPVKNEPDFETEEVEEYFIKEERYDDPREYSPPPQSPPRRQEPIRQEYQERRRNSYERETSPKQNLYYDKSPPSNANDDGENCRMVSSQSVNNIKDYTNGDRHQQQQSQQQQYYRQGDEVMSSQSAQESNQRRERYQCPASHRPPFNRRPVTRNSNILSAALCLVKELDYPSLEVLDMAVRCRMDELDE